MKNAVQVIDSAALALSAPAPHKCAEVINALFEGKGGVVPFEQTEKGKAFLAKGINADCPLLGGVFLSAKAEHEKQNTPSLPRDIARAIGALINILPAGEEIEACLKQAKVFAAAAQGRLLFTGHALQRAFSSPSPEGEKLKAACVQYARAFLPRLGEFSVGKEGLIIGPKGQPEAAVSAGFTADSSGALWFYLVSALFGQDGRGGGAGTARHEDGRSLLEVAGLPLQNLVENRAKLSPYTGENGKGLQPLPMELEAKRAALAPAKGGKGKGK